MGEEREKDRTTRYAAWFVESARRATYVAVWAEFLHSGRTGTLLQVLGPVKGLLPRRMVGYRILTQATDVPLEEVEEWLRQRRYRVLARMDVDSGAPLSH